MRFSLCLCKTLGKTYCKAAIERIKGSACSGEVAEWLMAADCKSARESVRWFESSPHHHLIQVAAFGLWPHLATWRKWTIKIKKRRFCFLLTFCLVVCYASQVKASGL